MEINRLRQFRTVVEAGGLLKASEVLGISGGGLSKSLKALEQELGYSLFEQRGRGLELTEMGKHFYERLPGVLQTIEDLIHLKEFSKTPHTTLRIVSFEVFTTYFLGMVGAELGHSGTVEIREAIPGQMEQLIAEHHSDLGITYLPIPHQGVEFTKVGKIKMGIFGLKKYRKGYDLKELPFVIPIAPVQGTPSGVRGLDGWPEHLFERKVQFRVEMMETAIQLCRRGVAVAFLPEFVASLANSQALAEVRLEEISQPVDFEPIVRDVFLIKRKGAQESKHLREIAKAIRRLS